jgi:hypothetical protein
LDLAGAKSSDRGTSFTHCSAGRHQALRIYYASRETPIAYPLTLLSTCPKPAIPVALYTAILDITCTVHCLFNPILQLAPLYYKETPVKKNLKACTEINKASLEEVTIVHGKQRRMRFYFCMDIDFTTMINLKA